VPRQKSAPASTTYRMTDQDSAARNAQDALYTQASAEFGSALARLAAATERDSTTQRDLLQEIHVALWRSFAVFQGQCSLRTWVYRVAHNAATTHVRKSIRNRRDQLMDLEELETVAPAAEADTAADEAATLEQLYMLIRKLKPIDRDVMLLYLEGMDGVGIAEVLGISVANVAQKIHRSKKVLQQRFDK
jgi:RNA polymerase sigma-70 factor (ECF subfamily)